jgi:hypothetical protein
VDFENLPTDKSGVYDFKTIYGEVIPSMAKQRQAMQAIQKAKVQQEAFRMGAIPSEITPEGEVKGYKIQKGQKPKLIPLSSLSQEEQFAALTPLKSQIDSNLPIEKQKRLLMDLAKKSGYQF